MLRLVFRLKIASEIDARGASRAEVDAQKGFKSRAEIPALLSKSPKVGRIRSQGGPTGARPRREINIEDGVQNLQGPPGAEIPPEPDVVISSRPGPGAGVSPQVVFLTAPVLIEGPWKPNTAQNLPVVFFSSRREEIAQE